MQDLYSIHPLCIYNGVAVLCCVLPVPETTMGAQLETVGLKLNTGTGTIGDSGAYHTQNTAHIDIQTSTGIEAMTHPQQ